MNATALHEPEQEIRGVNPIDRLEAAMANSLQRVDCHVAHRFTPGLYVREIHIPAGTMIVSMEHKTEHPFVISLGEIEVASLNEGSVLYKAPYTGVTKPHTKRVLLAKTDTIWTTFHVTNETDVDKIALEILEPHGNPLLPESLKNQWQNQSPKIEELCRG